MLIPTRPTNAKREHALNHGMLIDLSESATAFGITSPVAVSTTAWRSLIVWTFEDAVRHQLVNESQQHRTQAFLSALQYQITAVQHYLSSQSTKNPLFELNYRLSAIPREKRTIGTETHLLKAMFLLNKPLNDITAITVCFRHETLEV